MKFAEELSTRNMLKLSCCWLKMSEGVGKCKRSCNAWEKKNELQQSILIIVTVPIITSRSIS